MRVRPYIFTLSVALATLLTSACVRESPPAPVARDAVPLAVDRQVFSLIESGRCDEAARLLDALPIQAHDVQWFMRRGDVYICAYRRTASPAARSAITTHFEAGLRAFPDSSRLMLEYGVACTSFDDLTAARTWADRARLLASKRIASGQQAYGLDDERAVLQQAEHLLRILRGE